MQSDTLVGLKKSSNWYMQATAVLMQHVRDINALDKDQQGQTNLRHPPARHKQRRKPFFPYHKRQNHAQLEKGRSLSRAFTLASSLFWLRTPFHSRCDRRCNRLVFAGDL